MDELYDFRRLDNDELVKVDFETMMRADAAGFVVARIKGQNVELRRVREPTKTLKKELDVGRKVVSDSLGFIAQQKEEFETHRLKHGFTGIEFKPDPQVPGFLQVHASSQAELDRYSRSLGRVNATGSLGAAATMTPKDLERAKQEAIAKYGLPKKTGIAVDAG